MIGRPLASAPGARPVGAHETLSAAAAIAAFVVACVLLALFVRDHSYTLYDDSYIYLRYVKSIRAGCGLRFNCGDPPVEGFTSPLYLALLVVGSFFTTKLVTLTQVVCTGALAATFGVTIVTASRPVLAPTGDLPPAARASLRVALVVAVTAVLACDDFALINSVVGLEMPVTALVVTLTWLAVVTSHERVACALAILAFLSRPEGLLLIVALPVLPWARRPRVVLTLLAAVVGITLARFAIFGDVVPNTYWAKAGGTLRHAQIGAQYLGTLFGDHFPFIALAPLALLARNVRYAAVYVLVVTLAWFGFFLRSGGDVFPFSRLAFPLVPVLTILAARGVVEVSLRLSARLRTARGGLAPGAIGALVVIAGAVATRAASTHSLAPVHGDPKVLRWRALARWLDEHRPHATIATVPIGALSYYSHARVIDMLGLTTPVVAKAGRTLPPELLTANWIGHERHDLEWILDERPDLVVTTEYRSVPWARVAETRGGFYAEWLFVRAVKEGRAPYHVLDVPIGDDHCLLFERDAEPISR